MNTALNYQPEVLVDTADLSREDWLDYRRLGIGGSDAAAIMGLSPFSTIRDLYFDKIGVTPVIEEEEENWVAKEVGHRLEDLVAGIHGDRNAVLFSKVNIGCNVYRKRDISIVLERRFSAIDIYRRIQHYAVKMQIYFFIFPFFWNHNIFRIARHIRSIITADQTCRCTFSGIAFDHIIMRKIYYTFFFFFRCTVKSLKSTMIKQPALVNVLISHNLVLLFYDFLEMNSNFIFIIKYPSLTDKNQIT